MAKSDDEDATLRLKQGLPIPSTTAKRKSDGQR